MKNTKLIKIVAVVVIAAFSWQNLASANPDLMAYRTRLETDTLAPRLSIASEHGLELKGLMSLTKVAREALQVKVRPERLKEFIGLDADMPEEIIDRIDFSRSKISSDELNVVYEGEKGRRTITFSLLSEKPSLELSSDSPGRIIVDEVVVEINIFEDETTGLSPPEDDVTIASEGNIVIHEGKKEVQRGFWGRLFKKWTLVTDEGVNDVIRKYWRKGSPSKGCSPLKERAALLSILYENPSTKELADSLAQNDYAVYVYDIGRREFVKGISTHSGIRTGSIHITKEEYERLKALGIRHLAARIAHEVREIDLWRLNANKLVERKAITGLGIAPNKYDEKWAKGIRLWIRANCDNSGDGVAQRMGVVVHRKGLESEMSVLADTVIRTKRGISSEEYYRSIAEMASKFRSGGSYSAMTNEPETAGKKPNGLYGDLYEAIVKSLRQFKGKKEREYFIDILYARVSLLYIRSLNGGLEFRLKDNLLSPGEKATLLATRLKGVRDFLKEIQVIDDQTTHQIVRFVNEVEEARKAQYFAPDTNKAIVKVMVALNEQLKMKNSSSWVLPRMLDPKDVVISSLDPDETQNIEGFGRPTVSPVTDTSMQPKERLGEIVSLSIADSIRDQERAVTQDLGTDAILALLGGAGNWNHRGIKANRRSGTKSKSASSQGFVPEVPDEGFDLMSLDVSEDKVEKTSATRSKSKLLQPELEVEYGNVISRMQSENDYIEKIDMARRSVRALIPEISQRTGLPMSQARQCKIFYGSPTGYFDVVDNGPGYPHVVDITIIVNGDKQFTRRNYPADKMSGISAELPGVESINLIVVGTDEIRKAFDTEKQLRIIEGGIINFDERMEVQKLFIKALKEDIQVAGATLLDASKEVDKDIEKLEYAYANTLIDELRVKGREKEVLEEKKMGLALTELPAEEQASKSKLEDEIASERVIYARIKAQYDQIVKEGHALVKEQEKVRAKKTEIYSSGGGSASEEDLLELNEMIDAYNERFNNYQKEQPRLKQELKRSADAINTKSNILKELAEQARKAKEEKEGLNRKDLCVRRDFQVLRKRIEDIHYKKGLVEGMVVNNRYRVMNKLGQGGFGAVYRVYDMETDTEKAIKMLIDDMLLGAKQKAQIAFKNEKESLRRLSQPPHLVQVPAISGEGMYGGNPYFVMTLVKGLTLKEIINRLEAGEISLSSKEKLFLMYAVAKVLVAFHNAHEIHRDIKPENIMIPVDENGEIAFPWRKNKKRERGDTDWLHHPEYEAFCRNIFIIDLGISLEGESNDLGLTGDFAAKSQASMEAGFGSKDNVGSPRFMAPEQHIGSGVTSKTDVFSLGIIFFNLWTYHFPYADNASGQNAINAIGVASMNKERSFLCDVIEEENRSIGMNRKKTKDIRLDIDRSRFESIRPGLTEDLLAAKTGNMVITELPNGSLKWNLMALGEKTLKKRLSSIKSLDDEERNMIFGLVYPFLPEADGYIEALVNAMIQADEENRPTSMEIISEIEKYLTGRFEAMAYRPRGEILREGLGAKIGKWLDKRKGALAATLLVIVMALGGAITFLYKLYIDARDERSLAEAEKNRAKIEMVQLNKSKREAETKRIEAEAAVRVLEEREKQLEAKKAELERSKELIQKDKSSAEEARTEGAQALKEKEEEILAIKAALERVTRQLSEARDELGKLRRSVTVVFEDAKNSVVNHNLEGAFGILSERLSWFDVGKDNLNKYTLGYNEISDIMVDSGALKKAIELENKRIQLLNRAKDWHPEYSKEDKAIFEEAVFRAKIRSVELLRIFDPAEAREAVGALLKEKIVRESKNWSREATLLKIGIMLDEVPSLKAGKKRDDTLAELVALIKKIEADEVRDLYYGYYYQRTDQGEKAEAYFKEYSEHWKKQAAAEGIDPAEKTKRERKAAQGLLLAAETYTKSAGIADQNGDNDLAQSAIKKAMAIINALRDEHSGQAAILGWAYLMKGDLESIQGDTQDAREAYEAGLKLASSSDEKALIIILSRRVKVKPEIKDLRGALSDRSILPFLYLRYAKLMVSEEAGRRKAAFERAKLEEQRKRREAEEAKRREEERIKKEKERRAAEEAARKLRKEALAGIKEHKDARLKLEQIDKEISDLRNKRKGERDEKKIKAIDQQIERTLKKRAIVKEYMKANPPAPKEEEKKPEEEKPEEKKQDAPRPAKDHKQKGVGNFVEDAPDHRLLNSVIACAAEEGMVELYRRDNIEICKIGEKDFKTFMDVYLALESPEKVWKVFQAAGIKDGLNKRVISDLYSEGVKKLSNISGHAGLRTSRVFVTAGFPDVDVLIAHEVVEMKIHQQKALDMAEELKVASWENLTDSQKKMLTLRLREWQGYNDFAESAHRRAMQIAPVKGGIEVIKDHKAAYDGAPGFDLTHKEAPVSGGLKPIVDVDILAEKISEVSSVYEKEVSAFEVQLSDSLSKEGIGEGIVLFADDVLDSSAVFDLKNLAERVGSEGSVLKKIVLYARAKEKAEILERIILETNPRASVVVVLEEEVKDHYGREEFCKRSEVDSVLRYVLNVNSGGIFARPEQIIGVVRGPLTEGEEMDAVKEELRRSSIKVPVVAFQDSRYGHMYSLVEAVVKLAVMRSSRKGSPDSWIYILPPIRRLSEALQQEYREYITMLRALESSA